MKNKRCLIKQPHGYIELLFCMKLFYEVCDRYDRVDLPLLDEYFSIRNHLELPPKLRLQKISKGGYDFENLHHNADDRYFIKHSGTDFLPLTMSEVNSSRPMEFKYTMSEVDFNGWQECVKIKRNVLNESKILRTLPKKYNLICDRFYPKDEPFVNIEVKNKNKNVYIEDIEGTTIFDWIIAIENAQEIHFMDSFFVWLAECTKTKRNAKLYLYSNGSKYYGSTKRLLKKKWIYSDIIDTENDFDILKQLEEVKIDETEKSKTSKVSHSTSRGRYLRLNRRGRVIR